MGGTTIVDNLTSTSTSSALSANQGRVLNEKIQTTNTEVSSLDERITELENNSSSSSCQTKIWTTAIE